LKDSTKEGKKLNFKFKTNYLVFDKKNKQFQNFPKRFIEVLQYSKD